SEQPQLKPPSSQTVLHTLSQHPLKPTNIGTLIRSRAVVTIAASQQQSKSPKNGTGYTRVLSGGGQNC
ncbi:MAG: hypothetical protein OXB92_16935, partial [Acidimicrobiaceae bacterium]|nr:hypothetical protein [Acidimicrobiaceae bacterium]